MKLYRIRYKKSFVTRIKPPETVMDFPAEEAKPIKITIMPGVPFEHCEMIAAHWAERRVEVPAHDEEVVTVKPQWIEDVPKTIPGYWDETRVLEPGHYETQEIWIPEHFERKLVEIPGHYERQEIWVPEYTVTRYREIPGYFETRYRPTAMAAARGLSEPTEAYEFWVDATFEEYEEVIPAGFKLQRVWIDTTWEQEDVLVPGQYRDHRVWVDEKMVRKMVWVPETMVYEKVVHTAETVTTIVAVPVRMVREQYWQEEYRKCWMITPDVATAAGVPLPAGYLKELGDWFAWYQTTPAGQVFIDGAKNYGWFEDYTAQEIAHQAFEMYRKIQPDISIRVAPDVILKFRPWEFENMMKSTEGVAYLRSKGMYDMAAKIQKEMLATGRTTLTEQEIAMLVKAGVIGAILAAGALGIYYAWPGAKFDFKVTYTEWTYVLRYQEVFQYANIVGVSPVGKPTYHAIPEWGGPIIGEERSAIRDMWYFGEPWLWSAWTEEATWMGIGETRCWYEAEVEYLGMVKRSGANFYTLHEKISKDATAGHEPGWMLPSQQWDVIEEEWWHERI